jgi:glycosyltransferase involved in cell wall biosynthesis
MSDSPTSPSGFGNVTRFVCAGLAARGHQVCILGWQASGSPTRWQNCTLYPVRLNSFGADVLLSYLQKLQPDVLVTLADVWWLTYISNHPIANFRRTAGIPWLLYYPIDGDMGDSRLPPSWVRILQTVDLPIAMSAYGRNVTQANGVVSAYIPHGVDLNVFRPPTDKVAAKRALNYEGHFVILSDARNQPRKLLPRTLEIFRRFAAGKDDVLLHLHCDPVDPAAQTPEYYYDLRSDIAFLGLTEKVRLTESMSIARGLPLERLAAIYQAADVHLLSSWGEGFGLPTLQAAAAGVVPMASDYTASRELVTGHGEPIRVGHFLPDQFGLQRALIDIDDAVSRLEHLYRDPQTLQARSRAARAFAEAYDWEQVVPQWDDLLQREAPRLRQKIRQQSAASRLTLNFNRPEGPPELVKMMRAVMPGLPEGVQVSVNVAANKAGELTAEVMRDAAALEHTLTLPVSLPSAEPALVKSRVTGCVYLASQRDAVVARQLSRIFPGLNVWSTVPFDLGPGQVTGQSVQVKVVPANSPAFRLNLAASTLALDTGGCDPHLAALAAELRVPCIRLATPATPDWLWPELSMEDLEPHQAAELGRWMLTDQGDATELCAQAYERLRLALTSAAETRL